MTKESTKKLFIIFIALYFVQGMGQPGSGLLAQPIRSMLRNWGNNSAEIATFMFLLGLPWYIKPVFGLLTDFVPIRGFRRKSYLILSSSLMIVGFLAATILPLDTAASTALLLMLLLPSFGIASNDVATDATMIEKGQPLGITGRLQSAQWGAMYGAGLLTGVIGGWISQHGQQRLGFLICALLGMISLYIAIYHIKEKPQLELQSGQLKRAIKVLGEAMQNRIVILIAIFYFFVNFNPFSADVLYFHMIEELGYSEQFIGYFYTIGSVGAILSAIFYAIFAKRISLRILLHSSVFFMVISTLVYIGMESETSAMVISFASGFIYMITNLTQLELASRYCPPAAAGTVFALLMAVSNLTIALSSIIGGNLYETWKISYGADTSYSLLVLIGAGFTAVCWLLVLLFPKKVIEYNQQ